MSEESILNESEVLKRLERWTEVQPTHLEIVDFIQELNFIQIVDAVERFVGYIHNSKRSGRSE